jgi:hypothetical protein
VIVIHLKEMDVVENDGKFTTNIHDVLWFFVVHMARLTGTVHMGTHGSCFS